MLGVYPKVALDVINPAVNHTLTSIGQHEPVPAIEGDPPMNPPSIEYFQLSPMLIVFGVAVVGVLVEAFLPPPESLRQPTGAQPGGLVAAFVAVVNVGRNLHGSVGHSAVSGAVAVDAPALFLQGTILLIGVFGVLLIAERNTRPDPDWTPSPRRHPRYPEVWPRRPPSKPGIVQTEVFPLTMFAIGGMLLFPPPATC